MSKVHIVYYSYLGGTDPFPDGKYFWQDVIKGQLNDLKNSGIMNILDINIDDGPNLPLAKLYVVICSEKSNLLQECKEIVDNMCKGLNYEFFTESVNTYEYPGIKKIYDISKENPDSICLYMHSKQLGHSNVMENHRGHTEMVCTQNTLKPWQKVMEYFRLYSQINKACLFPSEEGFSWFNFWWARTNYIATCNEPTIEEDRYYYERWLGEQGSKTSKDCLSLFTYNIKSFSGEEACGLSHRLPFKI